VVRIKEIAFIDRSVRDLNTLMAGLRPEVEAILLDPSEPAARQMTTALHSCTDLRTVLQWGAAPRS
jgi:hypothetical protein